ncbi:MAG: BREX system P-loop protein BrxC [Desulfobacterales bacterium]|jgi:hypothetical protein|nr:BREX system P-loop protein BrxC [Desulfobacteraceae bacterium]MDY0312853.1 BREX system P-loop protein BrxC [Desulfobacterales bacterium]
MSLRDFFEKPVDRHIEGVIKADDEARLKLEIEEYVLTDEVARHLENFLDAYHNYEGANGVWISGFFGSGKSHLLKILSLILENREIDGARALDLFLPKCKDNAILRAGLQKAVTISSKSILFNIDQKADVISKVQIDALLGVFVKVFDEMCGYYGKQGYIAQFERDLDSRGQYADFKAAYLEIAGQDWEFGREQVLLEGQNIAAAYARVSGQPAEATLGILDKYRKDYKLSIEDFANQVQAFIESQPSGFRLNFFVDEVGQYIAGNTKLMTNLQTIAESLATKCHGRAWIAVTAQEEMDTVIGELDMQDGEDFSKIQDRFANRMKLTSANVAEVIQKRLLAKNDAGKTYLQGVYEVQANSFKTLFDFSEGTKTYKNFRDQEHFIDAYPFIPYQFPLFQAAIQDLSLHNAFEGRHSSVGERSMLGVFQQVVIQVANQETGRLATFDMMFEGIRAALKGNIQRSILVAEEHLGNPFAVQVLKALFLVKYVKEFKATVRNIGVLMLDRFDQDLPAFSAKVQEALNLLEQQTYIQRNGNLYEFLTDDEKDVEKEIKHTEVENADIAEDLSKSIFDQTLRNRKIRHEESGRDFSFSRKLDDRLLGREYELAIHVISPFNENAGREEILRMQSWGRDELLVILPQDERLMQDLLMYRKTEKYVRQNISITQQETIKRILTEKSFQNRERLVEIQKRVHELLGKATLYVSGDALEIGAKDPQLRIVQGFNALILKVYPNLRMLPGITYTENDIGKCLDQKQDSLFATDTVNLSEAEQEMMAFVQSNRRGGVRTTLKSLVERFERKPYGWDLWAIMCILAKLCGRGKIEVRANGDILEGADLEKAMRNTHGHGNVVLDPMVDFTASQLRRLKTFFEDFFDAPPKGREAKELGKETAEAFADLVKDLEGLAAQSGQYPFLAGLQAPLDQIRKLAGKPYAFYLTELATFEDPMLDLKESVLDPIRRFMSGPNRQLYAETRQYIQTQEPNLSCVEGDDGAAICRTLDDPACYKGGGMQEVKSRLERLKTAIEERVQAEAQTAAAAIAHLRERLAGMEDYQKLSEDRRTEIGRAFERKQNEIQGQRLIAVIRDSLRRFEDEEYPRLLASIESVSKAEKEPVPYGSPVSKDKPKVAENTPRIIAARTIRVAFDKPWLVEEADVERYLEAMRQALLIEIRKGKRIQI